PASGFTSLGSSALNAAFSGGASLMNPINFLGLTFPPAFFLTAPLAIGAGILGSEMNDSARQLATKRRNAAETFQKRGAAFRDVAATTQGSEADALTGLDRLFVTMRDTAGPNLPGQGFGADQTLEDFLEGRVTWPGFGGSREEGDINFEFAPLGEGLRRALLMRFPGLRQHLERPLNPMDAGRAQARRRAAEFARTFPARANETVRALSPLHPGLEAAPHSSGDYSVAPYDPEPGRWVDELTRAIMEGRLPPPVPPPIPQVQYEQTAHSSGDSSAEPTQLTLRQDLASGLWNPRFMGRTAGGDGIMVESGPGNLIELSPGDPRYTALLQELLKQEQASLWATGA
ncbi:MAG: hypothetical protein AAB368_06155, partial [bacterium]